MGPDKKNNLLVEELNTINKTFLLFNTRQELESFTGISFSNGNNASKSSGSSRYAAWDKLCKKVSDDNRDVELGFLLGEYVATSNYFESLKSIKDKKQYAFNILTNAIDSMKNMEYDVEILFLMLVGLLPKVNTNKGVPSDIVSDFLSLCDIMDEYLVSIKDRMEVNVRVVDNQRYSINQIIRKGLINSELYRARLIIMAKHITKTIAEFFRKSEIDNSPKVNFDASIEGFWQDVDQQVTNRFYEIRIIETDAFAIIRYSNSNVEITSEYVQMIFMEDSKFYIRSPKAFRMHLSDIKSDEELWGKVDLCFNITNLCPLPQQFPSVIIFNKQVGNHKIAPFEKLYRIDDCKYYQRKAALSRSIVPKCYEADYQSEIYAVTKNDIYIKLEQRAREIFGNFRYMKIPNTAAPNFSHFGYVSTLHLTIFQDNEVFLFEENTFYHRNITSPAQRDAMGIKLVDVIE